MTAKVIQLQVKSGIQRDGTQFAAQTYSDGEWVRLKTVCLEKWVGIEQFF